jgi:hypothetical protein
VQYVRRRRMADKSNQITKLKLGSRGVIEEEGERFDFIGGQVGGHVTGRGERWKGGIGFR